MSDPDLRLAHKAVVELSKALDSADYQPPEAPIWKVRAVEAIDVFLHAIGLQRQDRVYELMREEITRAHAVRDAAREASGRDLVARREAVVDTARAIADWLDEHAANYPDPMFNPAASALRKKASAIRSGDWKQTRR